MIPVYRHLPGIRHLGLLSTLFFLLLLLLLPGSGDAASPLTVLEDDSNHLRLQVSDLETSWREVNLPEKGVLLFEPRIMGMLTSGQPGHARTPQSGGWLLIPPGKTPRVKVKQEIWTSAGLRPLAVQPVPVLVEGATPDFRHTGEILVLPDEDLPTDAPLPGGIREIVSRRGQAATGPALQLGQVLWWRGHRIVAWQLNPLRHDGHLATESLVSGTWDIVFEADKAAAVVPAGHDRKLTPEGDAQLAGLFLNSGLLESISTEATHAGLEHPRADKAATGKGTLLGNMEGRIVVPATRLYRVTAARLVEQGFIPSSGVAEDQIRLYQRRYLPRLDDGSGDRPYAEIEVPIHMVGEGDTFDGDDFFVFYGLRPRDDTDFMADLGSGDESIFGCGDNLEYNNAGNIYWVAAAEPDADQSWARMEQISLDAASGTLLENYRRQEHLEEQVAYRQTEAAGFLDRLYYNHYRDTSVSIPISPLWSPDPNGGDISATVQMAAFSYLEQTLNFKFQTDNVLETELGSVVLNSTELEEFSFTAPAGAFAGETAKLMATNATGGSLYSWINWLRLSYDALYRAVGNRLAFHGGEGIGARPIEVTGFTNDDLALVEITDPRHPVWVNLGAQNIVPSGEGFKLSIMPVQDSGPRHFLAYGSFSGTGVAEFNYYQASLAADQVSPLDLDGSDPDLLVVLHPDFRETAQRWIDHRIARSGGDLNVHVAEVQDIYDWYSGGLKDPWAIKRLTTHAINQWGTWALVIIGDANENARQLGVAPEARNWSVDYVPTHYHIQETNEYPAEVLPSDKWYITFEAGMNYPQEDFPDAVRAPWQMYSGRLSCNSPEELDAMIDKIMVVDNVQAEQNWRRKLLLVADDAWSNGYGGETSTLTYRAWEEAFAGVEREEMKPLWEGGTPVTLVADTLFLDTYLRPVWEADGSPAERNAPDYQEHVVETGALQDLRAAMNGGALLLHYQGHANHQVLCSEYWFQDGPNTARNDVQYLVNADRPWVFFGMGCHISDWAQDPVRGFTSFAPSIGEKLLTHASGGASATYGSPGFEYISPNRDFGEFMIRRWILEPPAARMAPEAGGPVPHRSRWMLGELLWYSEADVLAADSSTLAREMVAQYQLLGDPLMMLDAGPAEVTATLDGSPISGEVELVAEDLSGERTVLIEARDEAGIDRLVVTDSNGEDLTAAVSVETLPAGAMDQQEVFYTLTLPVRAFAHQIQVDVFGTGAPLASDPHYTLVLDVPHEAVFTVDGEEIAPGSYVFTPQEPVHFAFTLSSGAWLGADQVISLAGENLTVTDVVLERGKANTLSGSFTAVAEPGTAGGRSVVMTIGGVASSFNLESDGAEPAKAAITRVMNYPNPMRDGTRFVFETTATSGQGQVRIFSVAGRTVANIPFTYSAAGEPVIPWDGRDNQGAGLANGTYLYRLEMSTPAGMLVSPMQRLVVMN